MWGKIFAFFLGVVLAPHVSKLFKPFAREAVKGAMLIGNQIQRTAAEVREDLEDIAAEAAMDLKSDGDK